MRWIILVLRMMIVSLTLHVPSGKRREISWSSTEIEYELNRQKIKKREQRLKRQKIFSPRYLSKRGDYKGSKSRDKRFSNQRMLRRMYRNS